MIVFPLVATGVSAAFSFMLLRQYAARKRIPHLAWGIALAQFALASIAVALGTSGGWTAPVYKIYWLFGALTNVPWLALGSIALLNRKPVTVLCLLAVLVGTAFAVGRVFGAHVNPAVLGAGMHDIPRGHDAWRGDGGVRSLASYYSYPAFLVVVALALWSSRAHGGVRPPRDRVRGNWFIAAGVTVVAAGSTALARLARGSVFSVTLAAGVAVMFAGFIFASRAPRYRVEDPGESPT